MHKSGFDGGCSGFGHPQSQLADGKMFWGNFVRMTNKQLARLFNELAGLMEIHEANTFKVRTYQNAYAAIRRQPLELYGLSQDDIMKIPGIGKSIASKISEHAETGVMKDLQDLRDTTPEGVRQMFQIRGIGAKKIKVIW